MNFQIIINNFVIPLFIAGVSGLGSLYLDGKAINLLNQNIYLAVLIRSILTTYISFRIFIDYGITDIKTIEIIPGFQAFFALFLSGITSFITSYYYYIFIRNLNNL